jgi:transcriptional regulator
MHPRKDHAETHVPSLREYIRSHPLGLFTTTIQSPSSKFPTLQASHIPFVIDAEDDHSEGELGTLRGHMDRTNPQSRALLEILADAPSNELEQEVLITFTSPVQTYISAHFYSETMSTTKRTAPTWNYTAVQVYGRLRIHHDSKDPEKTTFLTKQLEDLASLGERDMMGFTGANGSQKPWKLADAPVSYVERAIKGIIGLEITIERLEGKVKMSQELKAADRQGVVEGLRAMKNETTDMVADLVQARAPTKVACQ